jgi:4-hydroxy 2-oxovalerate aldolase
MYHDLTLRDGSHAISHQLTEDMIMNHCIFAEDAGIEVVEVGHGNGLGASSILIGKSLLTDNEMISTARKYLKKQNYQFILYQELQQLKMTLIKQFH